MGEKGQTKETDEALFCCDRLTVAYHGKPVVSEISFSVKRGEILGIVGESGSGKSTILKAAMGILGPGGAVAQGEIRLGGRVLSDLEERDLRPIRGAQMGMIFQDTKASLCPVRTIESQIYDMLAAHRSVTKRQARKQAAEMLMRLGLSDAGRILKCYPFQLSGGMNQRVGIAMAMLLNPALLLADEPTSALDAAVQKQTVEELLKLRKQYGTAILLVTHNMGVISAMADRVLILQGGRIVEYGAVPQVMNHPQSAYTRQLLDAVPKLRRD